VGQAEEEVVLVEASAAVGNKGGKLSTCKYLFESLLLIQCPFSVFRAGVPANVDARLTDNSQDVLVNALRTLRLKPNDLPVRPGFGTEGRPVKLRANFFPIKVRSDTYYEYDVALSPVAGTAIRRVKRRIFQLAEQSSDWERFGLKNTVAHDHSAKLISPKELPQPLSIRVPFYDEDEQGPKAGGKEYTLTITFIQKNDLSALLRYLGNVAHLRLEN
jgi:eukaryotic translation initiation factor 2C